MCIHLFLVLRKVNAILRRCISFSEINRVAGFAHENSVTAALLSILLLVHTVLVAFLCRFNFPNIDEVAHLPAGVATLSRGDFEYYKVNPPLVRSIAAIPLLCPQQSGRYPWEVASSRPEIQRPEFEVGYARLREVGVNLHNDFFIPRLMLLPISLLGLVGTFLWANDFAGHRAGIVAAAIWAFSPNVLSNAATINPDLAASTVGVLVSLALVCWNRASSLQWAIILGGAIGCAVLIKLTWLLALIAVPCVMVFLAIVTPTLSPSGITKHIAGSLFTALLVINIGYGFSAGSMIAIHGHEPVGGALGYHGVSASVELACGCPRVWIPFPRELVAGVEFLNYERKLDYESYLMGNFKKGTWIYYYFIAMLVKVPSSTLLLALLGLFPNKSMVPNTTTAVSFAVPLACFVGISLAGGFNHHFRYAIIALPVLFVMAGRGFHWLMRGSKKCKAIAYLLVCASIIAGVLSLPSPHSYFNLVAGGSQNGRNWLNGSNVEWGQDLGRLRSFVDTLPKRSLVISELEFRSESETILCRDAISMDHAMTLDSPWDSWTHSGIKHVFVIVHSNKMSNDVFGQMNTLGTPREISRITNAYSVFHLVPFEEKSRHQLNGESKFNERARDISD